MRERWATSSVEVGSSPARRPPVFPRRGVSGRAHRLRPVPTGNGALACELVERASETDRGRRRDEKTRGIKGGGTPGQRRDARRRRLEGARSGHLAAPPARTGVDLRGQRAASDVGRPWRSGSLRLVDSAGPRTGYVADPEQRVGVSAVGDPRDGPAGPDRADLRRLPHAVVRHGVLAAGGGAGRPPARRGAGSASAAPGRGRGARVDTVPGPARPGGREPHRCRGGAP